MQIGIVFNFSQHGAGAVFFIRNFCFDISCQGVIAADFQRCAFGGLVIFIPLLGAVWVIAYFSGQVAVEVFVGGTAQFAADRAFTDVQGVGNFYLLSALVFILAIFSLSCHVKCL